MLIVVNTYRPGALKMASCSSFSFSITEPSVCLDLFNISLVKFSCSLQLKFYALAFVLWLPLRCYVFPTKPVPMTKFRKSTESWICGKCWFLWYLQGFRNNLWNLLYFVFLMILPKSRLEFHLSVCSYAFKYLEHSCTAYCGCQNYLISTILGFLCSRSRRNSLWKREWNRNTWLKKHTHTQKYVTRTPTLSPGSLLLLWVIKTTLAPIAAGSPSLVPFSAHDLWSQWPFLGLVLGPFHCVGAERAHVQLIISLLIWPFWCHTPKSLPFAPLTLDGPQWKENACGGSRIGVSARLTWLQLWRSGEGLWRSVGVSGLKN